VAEPPVACQHRRQHRHCGQPDKEGQEELLRTQAFHKGIV
jgi:hypothetical protein